VDNVDAIVWTAYNGMRQGEAHAKVVFGDYNPGGHLTQTWYTDDSQLYSYPGTAPDNGFLWDYSIDNRDGKMGRTYMYFNGTPRYPFGYGLSYSSFTIGNMNVSGPADGIITVTADVTNTGAVDGAEVVQVYVKAPGAGNGIIPKQELRGFARVEVPAGQTRTATVKIELKDLAAIDKSTTTGDGFYGGRRVLTPGNYEIVVAYDSATPAASRTVNLTELPQIMKVVTLRNAKPIIMAGDTIGSEVSICMTDETFLDENAAGLSIVYSSSNTDVATVDPAGNVTALSGGTALITAEFSLGGQTMKADYPVVVLNMASLSEAFINGALVPGFRYNRFEYRFELPPCETTQIPELTWTAPPGCAVTYTPTEKIPGTSVIEVSRGVEYVRYEFKFSYVDIPMEGVDQELANFNYFASQGPRYTGGPPTNNNQVYFDWRNIGPVSSGSASFNLSSYGNREGLYLTFTMDFSAQDMSSPLTQLLASGAPNCVRLRSTDGPSNQERNFGWRPTAQWNLKWGKNYVRIPLGPAISRTISGNSDRTVPVSEYMINVNGIDVQAMECNLNVIDWSAVNRMILYVNTTHTYANNRVTMALEDVKIVDAGVSIKNLNEDVATFNSFAASRFPKYATSASNEMYADWTGIDGGSIDLKNHPHKDSLFLAFTMVWHSTNESRPITDLNFDANAANAVRLRSPDVSNKPGAPTTGSEHNFGWRINNQWRNQLRWGENKVRIPLGTLLSGPLPTTNNDTTASGYQININGVNITTTEKHLNHIDWASVQRIIMMIWPGGVGVGETVTLELKDVKILDATAQQMTAKMSADLLALMTPKKVQGDYTNPAYNSYLPVYYDAYLAAYEKAEKIRAIADWPSPFMCATTGLQNAIDSLVVFSANFTNSSASVKNPSPASISGHAIAAVYSKDGKLAAVSSRPFTVAQENTATVNFGINFSSYPRANFDYKVFFWNEAYVPYAPPVAPLGG